MVPPLDTPDGGPPPPPGKQALTTAALYAAHWKYVRRLLPGYGVRPGAHKDLAQTVWLTVHERLASYDPDAHKTPRAWLTGIVRRCAANHRRTLRRHPEQLTDDPGIELAARGLDPEQVALLRTLRQVVEEEEHCEALILRVQHGLSIEEIAAATGATEATVERRLRMAKQALSDDDDDDKKKSRAFLGFGSLGALAEALRPKPIPDELGAEEWKEIEGRIQRGEKPDPIDSDPPPSTLPPPAVPALAPSATTAAALTLTKGTLGGILAAAFFVGAVCGAGALWAWQAYASSRNERFPQTAPAAEPQAIEAPCPSTAAPVTATAPGGDTSTSSTSITAARPRASTSSTMTPRSSISSTSATAAGSSKRLILQMRHAAEVGNLAEVIALAEEHARTFPAQDVDEREAERRKALEHLRRTNAGGTAR